MSDAGPVPGFDTVILAGGGAVRMGGADKPGLVVGGRPLLVSVARAAAAAGTGRLVIVGPPRPGSLHAAIAALAAGRTGWLSWVREDLPGGGPVAGLRRGLAEVGAAWVMLLAADLPFLAAAQLTALLRAAAEATAAEATAAEARATEMTASEVFAPSAAGAVLADGAGRPQWLISCWQTTSLRSALAAYRGQSLHGLLAPLRPAPLPVDVPGAAMPPWLDCDTPDDLAAARRAWLANAADPGGPS